ncbi:hypothetical protein STM14_3372 [Salmonella enterica subsp. enterica serovar Typhimurium str. 14028S]|uniref:Uncharacterized protein n=1 Tax=Salmonella typhimurium (strain 14028s / SGSC 2262) TaxID=588858 RepID=A0A0F6B5J7_SALT1|nr:hypothetical protein STM14_3372 [Salmonella enterica subsp. enterica serovar Typhimurium str. 14028S]
MKSPIFTSLVKNTHKEKCSRGNEVILISGAYAPPVAGN